jgi:hypothetical protein
VDINGAMFVEVILVMKWWSDWISIAGEDSGR